MEQLEQYKIGNAFAGENLKRQRLLDMIALVAYEASIPIGLGMLHFTEHASEDDILNEMIDDENNISTDYVLGRCVKLGVFYDAHGFYTYDEAPRPDYQTWAKTYPSYSSLFLVALERLVLENDF